jgi:RNA polymerase sigma factor (sigma-70 family)
LNIDDDLIAQWEPKVQKFVSNTYVVGWDREDLAQELRIAIIKAAHGFQEDRGVLFHTYLHTAMVNTIRTLISKAQHTLSTESLDVVYSGLDDDYQVPSKILQALLQDEVGLEEIEMKEVLGQYNLSLQEMSFIELRLEGLTMEEISEDLDMSSYKIRTRVREKLKDLTYEKETESDGVDS